MKQLWHPHKRLNCKIPSNGVALLCQITTWKGCPDDVHAAAALQSANWSSFSAEIATDSSKVFNFMARSLAKTFQCRHVLQKTTTTTTIIKIVLCASFSLHNIVAFQCQGQGRNSQGCASCVDCLSCDWQWCCSRTIIVQWEFPLFVFVCCYDWVKMHF